jgi:hypothetical protein
VATACAHGRRRSGEDQDAFIADANLERRDLNKGQKAMLVAARFPDPNKRGRGNKSTVSDDFNVSETRIKTARAVRKYCSEMVPQIIDGSKSLDEAYAEANRRKLAGNCPRWTVQNVRGELIATAEIPQSDKRTGKDGKARKQLESVSEIPKQETRKGKDGKQYKAKKPKPAKPKRTAYVSGPGDGNEGPTKLRP